MDTVLIPLSDLRMVPLAEVDAGAVDRLLDLAFGADRRGRTAYRIRDGMAAIARLSLATLDEAGELLGTLQCWPVALDGVVPLTLVGPVAVMPGRQRGGVGQAMMRRMLAEADAAGADPQVLIGDPEYYGRFGFDDRRTGGWTVPGPVERRRLLARADTNLVLPIAGHLGPRVRPLLASTTARA